ncbi:MAG: pilus assembly protein [Acidobacteriia bacterium]|nr:pilus assembly protein [Terriglobia bacterium]
MRPRSGRRGSTLVEGSIILLLYMVIFVGILDMGQVFFFHHFLTERVRTGVRYAVVHTYDPTAIQNVVAYNSSVARPSGSSGLFGLTPSQVAVNRYDPDTPNDRIEVSVNAFTMHFMSPWLMRDFTPGPFRAVMPVESLGAAH